MCCPTPLLGPNSINVVNMDPLGYGPFSKTLNPKPSITFFRSVEHSEPERRRTWLYTEPLARTSEIWGLGFRALGFRVYRV